MEVSVYCDQADLGFQSEYHYSNYLFNILLSVKMGSFFNPHHIGSKYITFLKQCRSRSAGFWEASWSESTLFHTLLVNTADNWNYEC